MKNKFLLSILAVAFTTGVMAQEDNKAAELLAERPSLEIQKQLISFKKESRSAFSIYLMAPANEATKAWKTYLKEKYQLELKKSKGMLAAEQVSLADISKDKLDFYTMMKEDENGARLDILANKNGTYISPSNNPEESAAIESMMQNFARQFYVTHYDNVLADQRKEAEKYTKEHERSIKEGEKLVKEGASLAEDVTKAENGIVEADKKIAELEAKKNELSGTITETKGKIEENKKNQQTNVSSTAEKKSTVDERLKLIEKLKANADSFRTDN